MKKLKRASKSSAGSRPSKLRKPSPKSAGHGRTACSALVVISLAFVLLSIWKGWTLYFGDAQAHWNIARRIIDSRTPGFEQLGTVWLPLPHLLLLPFVTLTGWWRVGAAGAIPSALAYVSAGAFLFLTLRRIFKDEPPAWAGLLVFALNPNLLYLQSTPMTEALMLACVLGLLHFTVRFEQTGSLWDVFWAGIFAFAGTMTRYECWFLLPFAALYILLVAPRSRVPAFMLFCVMAALGPLAWLAHNWWYYGDALAFYSGEWSAKAIYQRALDAGGFRYPGDHDWAKALLYYRTAAALCAGLPLFWLGVVGILPTLLRRAWWPVLFLLLLPGFYVWSIHSSGTPIFVPTLWPSSYYNSRYGINLLPLLAVGVAALAGMGPRALRRGLAVVLVLGCSAMWVMYPRPDNWVVWKESEINSRVRRAWTNQAARYLRTRYRAGDGVFLTFGDLTGILREAGIPIRESLHEGNGPMYLAALRRPEIVLWEEWVIAFSGDSVARAIKSLPKSGPRYERVRSWDRGNEPAVEIYRRLR